MSGLCTLVPIALLGLLVGVLIGAVGIGGVMLVPALVYLGAVDLQVAIASCMLAYLFAGSIGALEFARRGSVPWSNAAWLCGGAGPGAYLGAATVPQLSSFVLEGIIAVVVTASGIHALLARPGRSDLAVQSMPWALTTVGVLVGFGSALTGTGGPLLLLPALLWLHVPILIAVGLSQVVQIPIAALATAANISLGGIDSGLAATLALVLMAGVLLGARLAHRLPAAVLRRSIAVCMVLVGGVILVRVAYGLAAPTGCAAAAAC